MREESERAIRERIERTRARLGDTIEQIGDRVNPDRVQRELKARAREEVDDFKHTVKQKARSSMRDVEHEVRDRSRGIWDTIKDNPVPAGMVGVGLAWLMANGGNSRSDDAIRATEGYRRYPGTTRPMPYASGYAAATGARMDEGEEGLTERAREKGEHAAERVRESTRQAADTAREKSSELTERASHKIDDAQDRARHMAHEGRERAARAEHRVEEAVQENPLAAGAIAAALGLAAGMMIPETRKEHELMGPTRDRALHRAQESMQRAGTKAREVARETAGESARQAVDEVMHGDRSAERESISEPGR